MKNATIVMAVCQRSKKPFAIRAEKIQKDWHFTWAFSIDEKRAKREGYDSTTIKGNIVLDNEYPGCPHCKNSYFVVCGNCNKIGCYNGKDSTYKCPECDNKGELTYTDEFDNIKGGGF